MDGNIEELVLSGKLFNPPSRSSSPVRTPSPSSPRIAQWPNDTDAEFDYDSDAERRKAIEQHISDQQQREDSIGMGPGRTGVKGVIRDRQEANAMQKAKKADGVREVNRKMEKASLGGKTWGEEEKERIEQQARLEGRSVRDIMSKGEALRGENDGIERGKFGHLREVGLQGYLQAIEKEDRNVWVLVHIYDPSLDRCAALDDNLARLARLHPSTKFLRTRAGAIGFASSQPSTSSCGSSLHVLKQPFRLTRTPSRKILVPGRYPTDEDDDDDDEFGSDGDEDEWSDDKVDTDVLPTMLVYRGGELVHSWIRVDWEAQLGMEELLQRLCQDEHRWEILTYRSPLLAMAVAHSGLVPDLDDHLMCSLANDPNALKACALVCRAWLAASRVYLFRHVTVQVDNKNMLRRFSKIIQQSPVITDFVRTLEFGSIRMPFERPSQNRVRITNEQVSFVLPRLSRLNTLV
ncbi:hypothetical protein EUX98_g9194 [Antrodiella citrinella]|uniref:Phosducin domain-containing protein n=1 Tax=Antrodiella citrinella TaxID=2447956 RepID=A0A4S4LZ41_9APHY|nr:hypothetical protein EUX98_g9194 [Antrodiella citrinella]